MSDDRAGEAFATELAELKRRGSALLVVSAGDGTGVCRDLLGSADEPRQRVVVRAAEFEELPVPGVDTVVVDATASDARSTAAYEPDSGDRYVAGGCDAGTLATAVSNEVGRVTADGIDSGELRVCLGSLDPLLERGALAPIEDALEAVFESVRSVDGMAHVHVSPDVDPSTLERLRSSCDVTVETRSSATGDPQQRWRLHDADIDSGWIQVHGR